MIDNIYINTDNVSEAKAIGFEIVISAGDTEILRTPQTIFLYPNDSRINEIGIINQITTIAQTIYNELLNMAIESEPTIQNDINKLSKILSKLASVYYILIDNMYNSIFKSKVKQSTTTVPNIGNLLLGTKNVTIGQVDSYSEEPETETETEEIEEEEETESQKSQLLNQILNERQSLQDDINISIENLKKKLNEK